LLLVTFGVYVPRRVGSRLHWLPPVQFCRLQLRRLVRLFAFRAAGYACLPAGSFRDAGHCSLCSFMFCVGSPGDGGTVYWTLRSYSNVFNFPTAAFAFKRVAQPLFGCTPAFRDPVAGERGVVTVKACILDKRNWYSLSPSWRRAARFQVTAATLSVRCQAPSVSRLPACETHGALTFCSGHIVGWRAALYLAAGT